MSTVKIKTEPTAAAAEVDVKVKLEPSLSTGDIKLEQHTSDIDTKVESDSEANDIKSESDDESDNNGGTDQHQRKFICNYTGCDRIFNYASSLGKHQHEHKLQTEINILGKTYNLTRQSLDDRWTCPTQDCTSTYKTVHSLYSHIGKCHSSKMKQQHQTPTNVTRQKHYFVAVDSFYVNGVRCGYHTTVGVFICHECRLVPECLLTHLQQKHGYDDKSIDNSALPESAVNASADPNINQHTSNPHLAAAIRQPYRQQRRDIVQGWLCVTSGCGFCGYTASSKSDHKRKAHQGEPITTVPALVLRLPYAKTQTAYFLITRLDTTTGNINPSSSVSQINSECDYDELVLSDYSDEDDIH